MATRYRIWCRTDNVSPGQFLVTVVALPDPPDTPGARVESESRLLRSQSEALEACARMVVAFGDRVRTRGDWVTATESV